MPRKPPAPPTTPAWQPLQGLPSATYTLRVVTPLFGGGHAPRQVDQDNPIHAASVRGHLRFWWRATAGARCKSAQELFEAEEKLWGSTEKPGKVAILVTVTDFGKPEAYDRLTSLNPVSPKYALFPFQENNTTGQRAAEGQEGVCFTLRLSGPLANCAEVKQALHAWVKFGGIGARTRRGCGSLAMDASSPPLTQLGAVEADRQLTRLAGDYYLGPRANNAVDAWRQAVEVYWAFRQQPGFARTPGRPIGTAPGRSRWPEADSIRRLAGTYLRDPGSGKTHTPDPAMPDGFPRADLGLPIIFQFKRADIRLGDPATSTLQGPKAGRRRFASPVITKAIQTGPNTFQPLIMILNAPHAWALGNVELDYKDAGGANRVQRLAQADIEATTAPLLRGSAIREALRAYVASRPNWTRETLP